MATFKNNVLKLSWIPYLLILFEMLYMATPFAVFFYSIYEVPLKFLNLSPNTAWMLQTVFPHFVETNSPFISILLGAGWLFMGVGILVFIIAFVQIYYAKFTKKGAVTNGLYRFIRHPQYTAWTLFGLGMCLVWSRIIVWLMFVTMTFIYYKLAKAEERECLAKFPDSYGNYIKKTGLFFPKFSKDSSGRNITPKNYFHALLSQLAVYFGALVATVLVAHLLRTYTIHSIASDFNDQYTAVSVTYMAPEQIRRATQVLFKDKKVLNQLDKHFAKNDKMILYILPQNWSIEELGMENKRNQYHKNARRQPSISAHGNPLDTDTEKKRVIVSLARLMNPSKDRNFLFDMKQQVPKFYVDVDLEKGVVTNVITSLPPSIYGDIPVPMY
ncbi:methyltransferase family protein [Maribacter sp. 2307ULW6-5]|uniref:methyltransferase family protein n=1 Tax=Maribacter sp. 2307ULW6-5 TaxID=3386275 RepID=UPI0039BC98C7